MKTLLHTGLLLSLILLLCSCSAILPMSELSDISAVMDEVTEVGLLTRMGYTKELVQDIAGIRIDFSDDNGQIGRIIESLPVPMYNRYRSFTLESGGEISISYVYDSYNIPLEGNGLDPFPVIKESNALLLFASINGLNKVNMIFFDDCESENSSVITYMLDDICTLFDDDLLFDNDFAELYGLLSANLKLSEFYFAHYSRIYLGATMEAVEYRNGEPNEVLRLEDGSIIWSYDGLGIYYFGEQTAEDGGSFTSLYATMFNFIDGESYDELTAYLGYPSITNDFGSGYEYIAYPLKESPRFAYFLLYNGKAIAEGVMYGDEYKTLDFENINVTPYHHIRRYTISPQKVIKDLVNSITFVNGELRFQIPYCYAKTENWNIHISGRAEYEDGFIKSLHYLDDVNESRAWKAGEWYIIPTDRHFLTGLSMGIYLPDENGTVIETSVDLLDVRLNARAPEYYTGEIDVLDLITYLQTLVKYIDPTVLSQSGHEQLDQLMYFAFECLLNDPRTQFHDYGGYSNWANSVSSDVLAEYLNATLSVDADYLDKYKDGNYVFPWDAEYYDVETDEFHYIPVNTNSRWLNGWFYQLSLYDTKIFIDGHNITVKTIVVSPEDVELSADYVFSVITVNDRLVYHLESLDVYDDKRNKNDLLLTLDDTDFYAPWYTVNRGGEIEYGILLWPQDYISESWSRPFPTLSLPPQPWIVDKALSYNRNTGIYKCSVHKGVAYLTFVYYGVCDVYVYDINNKTGHWMSGAENLEEFYAPELEIIREHDAEVGGPDWYYRNYDIVTVSQAHGYALLRRSLRVGSFEGEYLMLNLTTGEETFICDSYTCEHIYSFMDEVFKWTDDDFLLIGAASNKASDGWMCVYDVIFDRQGWVVSESDSPFWE